MEKSFVRMKEFVRRTNISLHLVRRLIREGTIPAYRVGRAVYVNPEESLEAIETKCRMNPKEKIPHVKYKSFTGKIDELLKGA